VNRTGNQLRVGDRTERLEWNAYSSSSIHFFSSQQFHLQSCRFRLNPEHDALRLRPAIAAHPSFKGKLDAGAYSFNWKAANSASGLYFCQLQAGGYVSSKKMILMK
jgi:hypothetical protein